MDTDDPPPDLLEALLAQSSDLVTVLDDEARVVYQSPAVERVLGYDPDDVVGDDVFEYVHPEDRELARETYAEVALGPVDESDPIEVRLRHADGSWVWVETLGRVADVDAIDGYVVDSRDITDRKRAERERDEILDRMTDAFIALDDEWRFTYLNSEAEDLLEASAEELTGENVWDAFPEARGTIIHERYEEAMASQETTSFEVHYDPLDTTFEIRAFPSESGLSVYFRDVTEARRIKRELERNVGTLQQLYETTADTELSMDEKRERLLELGRTHLDLPYGFITRIEDGTQHIVDSVGTHELLQPGESCPLEESYCRKTIETESLLSVHDAVESGWAGDRAYEAFELGSYIGGRVEVDGELYGTLCFASSDARARAFSESERTFVEVACRWLAYELEEASYRRELERQNDRLDSFAEVVTHDLRNPLSVVKGRVELASQDCDSEELEAAADSLDRAFDLIDDVLTFARAGEETLDPTPVPLQAVARQAWGTCDTADADLVLDDADGSIEADEPRLRQLLENLFRNAVEHGSTSPRSNSREDAVEHAIGGVTVRVSTFEEGFYVADDGPGIPPDEREDILEFGYSGGDSTGFGLAIVDEIAEAHGWSASVTEADGGGTRVEIHTDATDPVPVARDGTI